MSTAITAADAFAWREKNKDEPVKKEVPKKKRRRWYYTPQDQPKVKEHLRFITIDLEAVNEIGKPVIVYSGKRGAAIYCVARILAQNKIDIEAANKILFDFMDIGFEKRFCPSFVKRSVRSAYKKENALESMAGQSESVK